MPIRSVRLFSPDRPQLLGQVVADQREVDLVDQAVADEGAQHLGLQLLEPQAAPLALQQVAQALAVGLVRRHPLVAEVREPREELVEPQRQAPLDDPRVGSEQSGHRRGDQRARSIAIQERAGEQEDRRLVHCVAPDPGLVVGGEECLEPGLHQAQALGQRLLQRAQIVLERRARPPGVQQPHQPLGEPLGIGAGGEARVLLGQLLGQVAAGDPGVRRRMRDAARLQERADPPAQLVPQRQQRRRAAEDRPQPPQRPSPAGQLRALLRILQEGPVEAGPGARRRVHGAAVPPPRAA